VSGVVTPYDKVIRALRAKNSRRVGNNWQCPSHDDRNPSLSVNQHADGSGAVLMHCHAGCSTILEICPALGLDPADLFPGNGQGVLFPPSKYSPIGIDVVRKTPPSAHRTLYVAGKLGRYVDRWGGRTHVENTRQILCVALEAKHRLAVRDFLGLTAGGLRNDILRWREWGVAHACSRQLLTILVRDSEDCPLCKASLVGDGNPSKASLVGDAQYSQTSSVGDASRHVSKATTPGFFKELDGVPVEDRDGLLNGVRALEYLKAKEERGLSGSPG
jgi:hypothetical protein